MNAFYRLVTIVFFVIPLYLLVHGLLGKLYVGQMPDWLLGSMSFGFASTVWGIIEAFLTIAIKQNEQK